jgi:hypothetical protein
MALPVTLNPAVPPDSETPEAGALRIRNLTQAIIDIFGLPSSPTAITASPFTVSPNGTVTFNQGTPGVTLLNNTGGTLLAGNAVSFDATTDRAVALSDLSGSLVDFVIALGTIAPGASGPFAQQGVVITVTTQGAVVRGNYVRKSATTLAIEDTGTAMASGTEAPSGAIGVALSAAAGPGAGTCSVYLIGATVGGGGASLLSGARVYNTAGQTFSGLSSAAITFNTARYNRGTMWAIGSPTRLTAPSTGIYVIGASIQFSIGRPILWFRVNGATQITSLNTTNAGQLSPPPLSTIYQLNATDYVEAMITVPDSGSLTNIAAGNYTPEFYAQLVSS